MKDLEDFPKLCLGGARSRRLPPGKTGDVEDGAAGVAGSPVVGPPKLGVPAAVACPATSGRHPIGAISVLWNDGARTLLPGDPGEYGHCLTDGGHLSSWQVRA